MLLWHVKLFCLFVVTINVQKKGGVMEKPSPVIESKRLAAEAKTIGGVVVHHARCLHKSVTDRATDELEAVFL